MDITFISDTHTFHREMNDGLIGNDVVIHSGDISNIGGFRNVSDFLDWFFSLEAEHKIFIAGNHDISAQTRREKFRDLVPDNVTYLENEEVTINGIKIWGSPVTPTFGFNWVFNYDRGGHIRQVWSQIPDDTDILVTHGPPYGRCDKIIRPDIGEDPHRGCEELLSKVTEIKPIIHAFGHIHEARGIYHDRELDTAFINASTVDVRLFPVNDPIRVYVDEETKEANLITH